MRRMDIAVDTSVVLLERACAALTSLVREEYPEKYSLAEIADIWGVGISPEQIEALRWLENGGTDSPTESESAPSGVVVGFGYANWEERNMSHTPGPWTIYPGNGGGFVVRGGVPTEGVHATTHSEADARLIAAAPDLLEACERGLSELTDTWPDPDWDATVDLLRAAVAKARGIATAPPAEAEGASR